MGAKIIKPAQIAKKYAGFITLKFAKSNNLKVLLPNSCYHFIVFLVTETLYFQIIFVTLRQKSKH